MSTQKEVAEKAGVSFITVSRVVNGVGNVKDSTRQRVEAAIKALNYHPNRQAQALNNGLTRSLAFVTPRMYNLPLFNNFFVMSLLSGVETRGRAAGWDILVTTDFDLSRNFDFLRVWHQRKVDGLIFVGFQRFPEEQRRIIEERDIPCVSIADRVDSPAISWVDTDNRVAARDAVLRLLERGHRKFAYIGTDPDRDYNPNFISRGEAVAETLAERGLTPRLLISDSSTPTTGVPIAQAFLAMEDRPTAIISGNDSIAFNFMAENARRGVFCPRDYSIVGFDAEPAGRISSPTLASYEQPLLEMGSMAANILIEKIIERGTPRRTMEYSMHFVDGASLG